MEVSYKGVTGKLLKLVRDSKSMVITFADACNLPENYYVYMLEIEDATNGSKVCFENVDLSEVEILSARTTLAKKVSE